MPQSSETPKSTSPRLVVISAPSGAGKTTLCQRLLKEFPSLILSISCTTRPPRGEEQHGREYFFMTREEFEKQMLEDRFAEWALVHRNYYGTSRETIEKAFADGKHVLLDIDVQGAESFRQLYPTETFSVFVSPPSIAELEKRLQARGTDSADIIQRRVHNANQEMTESKKFHAVVVNDDLDRAYAELREIVRKVIHG